MPLEAKRSRHVAVAVPQVRVSRGIVVRPRQKSPQPQLGIDRPIPSVTCNPLEKAYRSGGGEWLTDRRPDLTRLPRPGEPVATETSDANKGY